MFLTLSLVPLTGLAIYIGGNVRDLQVKTASSGLMNVADAKQHGVIRFIGQNHKLALSLAAQVEASGPQTIRPLFTSIVATDVFRVKDHPFKAEIIAGKRHIPTLTTYRAIDFVRNGAVVVSSDPKREGMQWDHPFNVSRGYSEVYSVDGKPYLTFGAPARGGMVYIHADALMLTNIVNGEIGNLEGGMGAFYLAGVGKTFDYYLVNRENIMITESRVYPHALLRQGGSLMPWERTLHGQDDPACGHDGRYTPNAGVPTSCREAMGFYRNPAGQEMLGASMPFYDSGWTIVVEQQKAELLTPLTTLQNRIWVILGLIILAITLLAYGVARRIAVKDANSLEAVHDASHDPLTGLPNRHLFLTRLEDALSSTEVSVLFIDLTRFKAVNDSLGHTAGDDLLRQVGKVICSCLRDEDIVSRIGGDEFAVLLGGTTGPTVGEQAASRIIQALKGSFLVAGKEVFIGASIGLDFGSAPLRNASNLLSNADFAMYHAKKEGSHRVVVFEAHMLTGLADRLELPGELQSALGTDELWLQFQPLIDLASGDALGVEALARWTHPRRGPIPPSVFIPIAEETGFIIDLGLWVLRESCLRLAYWRRSGFPTLTLSVNVSGRQLLDSHLAFDVAKVLATNDLPGAALTLELTETVLMDDPTKSLMVLGALKELGVRIAVDDFGTGYSSLTYLRQFPVDELKIDKSFIDRVDAGPEDVAIVRTVIELAQALDMQTTAEGIETPEQVDSLRRLGCDVGQGYYFARPLDADHLMKYLTGMSAPKPSTPQELEVARQDHGYGEPAEKSV